MSVDDSVFTAEFLRLFTKHRLAPPHLRAASGKIHVYWSNNLLESLEDSKELESWQREVIAELTGGSHVLNWLRTHGLLPSEVFGQVGQVEAYRFANYLGISVGQVLKALRRSAYRVPYAETFIEPSQLEEILVKYFSYLVPAGRLVEDLTERRENDRDELASQSKPLDDSAQKWLDEYLANEADEESNWEFSIESDRDLHSCLAVLMSIAAADGFIDGRELDEIYRAFRDDFGCNEQQLDTVSFLLDHPEQIKGDWTSSDFPLETAKGLLEVGFRVAKADDEFHESEKTQLAILRGQFGIANDLLPDPSPRLPTLSAHQKRLLTEFLFHPACYLLDRSFLRQILTWREALSFKSSGPEVDDPVTTERSLVGSLEPPIGQNLEAFEDLAPLVIESPAGEFSGDELADSPSSGQIRKATSSANLIKKESDPSSLKERLRVLLERKTTDSKPTELWEEYSKSYGDDVTQRQIHELLLLDKMFSRTRSGHFQLSTFGKPKALSQRWAPQGPLDWLIAMATEISQTTDCENEEKESAALVWLIQALVDCSELEVASLKDYVARVWFLPKASGFWSEAKLPLALANLVTLAGVLVAASDRSPSLEEQRTLTRVGRAVGVSGQSLANQLHDFAYRKRLNTSDEQFFLTLEMPELKDKSSIVDRYERLVTLYRPEEFSELGVEYGLFAEKRLVKMKMALNELTVASKVGARPVNPQVDIPVSQTEALRASTPSGMITIEEAAEYYGVSANEIYELTRRHSERLALTQIAAATQILTVVKQSELATLLEHLSLLPETQNPDLSPTSQKAQRQDEPESSEPVSPSSSDKVMLWAAQSQRFTQPVGTAKEVYTDNRGNFIGEQLSQALPIPAALADLITINQASKLFEAPLSDLYAAAYRGDLEFRGYKKVVYSRTGREGQKIRLLDTKDVHAWLEAVGSASPTDVGADSEDCSVLQLAPGTSLIEESEEKPVEVFYHSDGIRSKPNKEDPVRPNAEKDSRKAEEIFFDSDGNTTQDPVLLEGSRTIEQLSADYSIPVSTIYLAISNSELKVDGYKAVQHRSGQITAKQRLLRVAKFKAWLAKKSQPQRSSDPSTQPKPEAGESSLPSGYTTVHTDSEFYHDSQGNPTSSKRLREDCRTVEQLSRDYSVMISTITIAIDCGKLAVAGYKSVQRKDGNVSSKQPLIALAEFKGWLAVKQSGSGLVERSADAQVEAGKHELPIPTQPNDAPRGSVQTSPEESYSPSSTSGFIVGRLPLRGPIDRPSAVPLSRSGHPSSSRLKGIIYHLELAGCPVPMATLKKVGAETLEELSARIGASSELVIYKFPPGNIVGLHSWGLKGAVQAARRCWTVIKASTDQIAYSKLEQEALEMVKREKQLSAVADRPTPVSRVDSTRSKVREAVARAKAKNFGFVSSNDATCAQLGVGKLVEVKSSNLATISYFDSPQETSVVFEVPVDSLAPVTLQAQTRCFWMDRKTGIWRVGRVVLDSDKIVHTQFPNDEMMALPYSEVYVRWNRAVPDPSFYLADKITESPIFSEARRNFLAMIQEQRVACSGMPALLSSIIELENHQVNVVKRVLQDSKQRYLLADEVGLGKTIEAGVLIRQYTIDQPDSHRIAVLVPAPLVNQWTEELSKRFLLGNRLNKSIKIVAMDDIVEARITLQGAGMIVVDEAQYLCLEPDLYELVRSSSERCSRLLLLSATPVFGNEAEFLKMLHLLDPIAYKPEDLPKFREMVSRRQTLAQLVAALVPENQFQLEDIIDQLLSDFPDDDLLAAHSAELRAILSTFPDQDSPSFLRSLGVLKTHLSESYRIDRRVLRNRRSSVHYLTPERSGVEFIDFSCSAHGQIAEKIEHWRSEAAASVYGNEHTDEAQKLARVYYSMLQAQLEGPERLRQFLCCPEHAWSSFPSETALVESLLRSLAEAESSTKRLEALVSAVVPSDSKYVVFCSNPTLADQLTDYLKGQLAIPVRRHTSRVESGADWTEFLTDKNPGILVCDRRAEEGLNLHGGNKTIIHFDLPFFPNRIEQRTGRVDRYGTGDSIRSIVLRCLDDQLEVDWGTCNSEGWQVFSSSLASLQFLVDDRMKHLGGRLLTEGVDAVLDLARDLGGSCGSVAKERRKIDQQNALDALSNDTNTNWDSLGILDLNWRRFRDAARHWIVNTLHVFERQESNYGIDEVVRFSPSQKDAKETLIPSDYFANHFRSAMDQDASLTAKKWLSYPYTFKRSTALAAVKNSDQPIRLLRIGDDFLEALDSMTAADDRGRSVAIWRRHKQLALPEPQVYFRCDFHVDAQLDFSEDLGLELDISELRQALRLRADESFPPKLETVWLDDSLTRVHDQQTLNLLESPYSKTHSANEYQDANLNHQRWRSLEQSSLVSLANWKNFVLQARAVAEELLRQTPALQTASKISGERATGLHLERMAQLRNRLRISDGNLAQDTRKEIHTEALSFSIIHSGILSPRTRLDTVTAIFLCSRSIDEVVRRGPTL